MTISKHSSMLCGHRHAAAAVISGKRRPHHERRAGACFSLHVRRAAARVDLQET